MSPTRSANAARPPAAAPARAGALDPTLPPDIALPHAFLNTLDQRHFVHDGGMVASRDLLATRADLTRWLATHELPGGRSTATAAELSRARELRAQLRACLTPPLAGDADGRDVAQRTLTWPVDVALTAGAEPALAPTGTGVDAALGLVAAAAARAALLGSWARLKVCAADDCRWVFYDRSKPNRGRWCDPLLCGNRMKTRAYRARQRARQPG